MSFCPFKEATSIPPQTLSIHHIDRQAGFFNALANTLTAPSNGLLNEMTSQLAEVSPFPKTSEGRASEAAVEVPTTTTAVITAAAQSS